MIRGRGISLSVRRGEWPLFATMFSLVCLIHLNFWILRSLRSTVAVADRGGAAELIPFFELWAALPASIIMTWTLSWLMRRLSMERVFYITTSLFLVFYLCYGLWLYPYSQTLPVAGRLGWGPSVVLDNWVPATLYVVSEMWKVALLSLLFWGYANRHLLMDQAKRFYAPLLLGGSVGALLAGPITMICTIKQMAWQQSIHLLLSVVVLVCIGLMVLFALLCYLIGRSKEETCATLSSGASLTASAQTVFSSPYLSWLGAIVVFDYLAYTLSEVVFLDVLKEYCVDPTTYCHYMGHLTFWSGLLTAMSALWLAPRLLENYPWGVAALATPILFLVTTAIFFGVVCFRHQLGVVSWLPLAVAIGSVKHCLLRAAKFTLFDTTRELAYIPLTKPIQMQGKLIIDGIGARAARATSSVVNMGLISVGGFIVGAPIAGGLAISFAVMWVVSACTFSQLFERISGNAPSAQLGLEEQTPT